MAGDPVAHECDDPTVCPSCQDGRTTPTLIPGWGRAYHALSGGVCAGCDQPIAPGQTVRWRDVDGRSDERHDGACLEDPR